jgi:hypothetical protein
LIIEGGAGPRLPFSDPESLYGSIVFQTLRFNIEKIADFMRQIKERGGLTGVAPLIP